MKRVQGKPCATLVAQITLESRKTRGYHSLHKRSLMMLQPIWSNHFYHTWILTYKDRKPANKYTEMGVFFENQLPSSVTGGAKK